MAECAVEVRLAGFEDQDGQVIAKVFGPGDDVFGPGRLQVAGPVGATIRLAPVACGQAAVIVFHDQNGDGTLSHRWGLPAEPLAFSNGFALGLFSGLPTFEKLAFPVTGTTTLDLVLR